MKGQLDIPIVIMLFTIFIVLGILMGPKFLTSPSIKVIQYEENYQKTQMILISLLSSTYNGKTVQDLIGSHLALSQPSDLSFIGDKLDKLVESKCYGLSTSSEILSKSSGCDPKEYTADINISLPYSSGKLVEKLVLVIN